MSIIKPETYNNAPGLAQNLSQVEVSTDAIPALSTEIASYSRYSVLAYNVNSNGISDIVPDRYSVAPALAQNLTYVEVDTSVIPALSGNHGVYPRYAQLVYLLNPSGGGSGTGAVESVQGKTGNVVLSASDLDAYTKSETDNEITTNTEPLSVDISSLSASVWDENDSNSIISKLNNTSKKFYSTAVVSQTGTLLNVDDNSTVISIADNTIVTLKLLLLSQSTDKLPEAHISYKMINLMVAKLNGVLSSSDASIQTLNVIGSDIVDSIDVQQINEDLQISITTTDNAKCYLSVSKNVANMD